MARTVVAEAMEQQGRHEEALEWALAELNEEYNYNTATKTRAGRVSVGALSVSYRYNALLA